MRRWRTQRRGVRTRGARDLADECLGALLHDRDTLVQRNQGTWRCLSTLGMLLLCAGEAGASQIAPTTAVLAQAAARAVAVSGSAARSGQVTARPAGQACSARAAAVNSFGSEAKVTERREETHHGRFRVPPDDVALSVYTNVWVKKSQVRLASQLTDYHSPEGPTR